MQKLVEERLKKLELMKDLKGPFSIKISDVPTGTWRHRRPVVDEDTCIVCGICEEYCPCGVIDQTSGKVVVDFVYCKGCGVCSNICPKKAIEMKLESKCLLEEEIK